MKDYDGATVVDTAGTRIGRVERSYVDEGGTVRFVAVKLGSLLAKHRLVPATTAQVAENGLAVPYTHDDIVASPDASAAGDTLEGRLLAQVRAYYADSRDDAGDQDGRAGTTEDTGERTRLAGATSVADAPGGRDGQQAASSVPKVGPRPGVVRERGDVVDIPIVEEEIVTRPVVKEVLRVRKKRVTTPQTVQATLRKEEVQVTHEGDAVVRDERDERDER